MAKNKNTKTTTIVASIITLAQLAEFGENGTFAKAEQIGGLVDAGHAEVGAVNAEGLFPVRITFAGLQALNAGSKPAPSPEFKIESDIPLPKVSVGRKANSTGWAYPFPALAVGQSFVIRNVNPEQVKKLKGAVGNANRRFSVPKLDEAGNPVTKVSKKGKENPVTVQTCNFVGREVVENEVSCFRIWRKA
jgi:hypothetical protein